MSESGYRILVERGIPHFAPGVLEKLTIQRWFGNFEKEINLDAMPVLKEWYKDKLHELNTGEPLPDERWNKTIALLGVLHSSFDTLDLPAPDSINYPYARKTYCLSDVIGVPQLEVWKINDQYSRPDKAYFEEKENPWLLRRKLAAEFAEFFLNRIRELSESVNKKSSVQEIVQRNGDLRALVQEASLYNSVALFDAFYKALPDFFKELEKSDAAVRFALSILQRKFINNEPIQWNLLNEMFDSYWDALKDMKGEAGKIVEILKIEISDSLRRLSQENRRLQRRVNDFESA